MITSRQINMRNASNIHSNTHLGMGIGQARPGFDRPEPGLRKF